MAEIGASVPISAWSQWIDRSNGRLPGGGNGGVATEENELSDYYETIGMPSRAVTHGLESREGGVGGGEPQWGQCPECDKTPHALLACGVLRDAVKTLWNPPKIFQMDRRIRVWPPVVRNRRPCRPTDYTSFSVYAMASVHVCARLRRDYAARPNASPRTRHRIHCRSLLKLGYPCMYAAVGPCASALVMTEYVGPPDIIR